MNVNLPMFSLDSTLEFEVESDANGRVELSGSYSLDPSSLLVLGIPFDQISTPPPGFNRSDGGFFFRYLAGTGQIEQFRCEFPHPNSGAVKMFLKRWYTDSEITFQIDGASFSDYVFVQGSCVSRDLFEFAGLSLSGYRARSSFASMASKPIPYDLSQLQDNPSEFQRRMVKGDIEKTDASMAASAPGDIILVDLIDERLSVVEHQSSVFTLSPEYQKTTLEFGGRRIDPFSEQYFELFESGWTKFASQVCEKHLVLNRVYWASHCEDGSELPDQNNIERQNEKLERLYSIIAGVSPEIYSLEYQSSDFVAANEHKWGRSPFHYAQSFNESSVAKLRAVIGQLAS